MHVQGASFSDVVGLTIVLSERVTQARRQGQPASDEQIAALKNVASILREYEIEWPPQLGQAIHEIIEHSPKGRHRSLLLIEYIQSGAFYHQQSGKLTIPFVMDLYRLVLGRDAEEDAIRHWSAQLNLGNMTKKQLLGTVIDSVEFRNSLI